MDSLCARKRLAWKQLNTSEMYHTVLGPNSKEMISANQLMPITRNSCGESVAVQADSLLTPIPNHFLLLYESLLLTACCK